MATWLRASREMAHSDLLVGREGGTSGYLRVANEDLALQLLPTGLYGCPRLCAALRGQEQGIKQRHRRNSADAAFLTEVRDMVERQLGTSSQVPLPSASFYELLVTELDDVWWGTLLSISPALDEVVLALRDSEGREHALALTLPPDYPRAAPRTRAALPAPFDVIWPRDAAMGRPVHSLRAALDKFGLELAKHQVLWDMLDDIDAHTWVRAHAHAKRVMGMRRASDCLLASSTLARLTCRCSSRSLRRETARRAESPSVLIVPSRSCASLSREACRTPLRARSPRLHDNFSRCRS